MLHPPATNGGRPATRVQAVCQTDLNECMNDCVIAGLRNPGSIFVSSPSTSRRVTKASSIAGGDWVIAPSGDDLLVRLAVEGLDVGEGVGCHDSTFGKSDIDGLGQISAGAGSVLGIVTGARALAIGAA